MRRSSVAKVLLMSAACCYAAASWAQMNPGDLGGLANLKMVEPSPELPGDRAKSCNQLASEMGEIMKKRNMKAAVASSKKKICSSTQELNRLGEERKQLAAAQMPSLQTAAIVGGPVANAIVNKTSAEQMALEARQQPGRQQAMTQLHSGVGDMVGVMNDPRLMRLGMLAIDKQCGEGMAPPPDERAPAVDACGDVAEAPTVSNKKGAANKPAVPNIPTVAPSSGPVDPFVKKGATQTQPAAADPFAKR